MIRVDFLRTSNSKKCTSAKIYIYRDMPPVFFIIHKKSSNVILNVFLIKKVPSSYMGY